MKTITRRIILSLLLSFVINYVYFFFESFRVLRGLVESMPGETFSLARVFLQALWQVYLVNLMFFCLPLLIPFGLVFSITYPRKG